MIKRMKASRESSCAGFNRDAPFAVLAAGLAFRFLRAAIDEDLCV